jgi:hypothetical protein
MLVLLSRSQLKTVAEMTRGGSSKLAAVRRLISLGQKAYDNQEQVWLRYRPLSKIAVTLVPRHDE